VLEIGAGTGRVARELAKCGHRVTALDVDAELLAELRHRAKDLPVTTVCADARDFELGRRFAICVVPMQAIQLLGGREQRLASLRCVARHLRAGGVTAIALADELDCFDAADGQPVPLPDICERDGVLYCSQPTAVRSEAAGFVLERRRETVTQQGVRSVEEDVIRLDSLTASELEREGREAGLRPAGRTTIEATLDHSGSLVVMLRG
jgi:SAM-dependent methyltransferase